MKISDLLERLEQIREDRGDLDVCISVGSIGDVEVHQEFDVDVNEHRTGGLIVSLNKIWMW